MASKTTNGFFKWPELGAFFSVLHEGKNQRKNQQTKARKATKVISVLCLSLVLGTALTACNSHARDTFQEIGNPAQEEKKQERGAEDASTATAEHASTLLASKYPEDTDTLRLSFDGGVSIDVEYADEPHERQLGLMYRREMCEHCGMLFKFDSVRTASIWMKNTYIPLDLAYINAFGKIVDIKQLIPHDTTSVPSSMPVLYALEMNEGWFAAQGIEVGDKLKLPRSVK